MILEMNMVQTIALAVVLLLLGEAIVKKSKFLTTYCIPSPVVGGLIFAILALILKQTGVMSFDMDTTLQTLTMTMFFTSVGFSASFALLKEGGLKVIIFLACAVGLVVLQNILGVGLAKVLNLDPLLGLATGSIPMTGGHGTAASFGPLLENEFGVTGASSVAVAAATFGLVAGGMLGGPVGRKLIEGNNLSSADAAAVEGSTHNGDDDILLEDGNFYTAVYQILIAMGIGTIISGLLQKTGLTFPPYIGAMLAGAIMRNISDVSKIYKVPMVEIDVVGGIALSLFLSMALMTLRLWELAELAIPMLIMLVGQVVLMFLFAYFITFNVMGRDYDAAILAAGHCGFGLGATPNGIANMNSVAGRYGPSPAAFFILPLVGSLFIDFFNTGVLTAFINFLS